MKRTVSILCAILISFPAFGQGEDFLKDLVDRAMTGNPGVRALRLDWESKRAKIKSEKWLPKPKGSVMFFGEPVQTKTGPQKEKYSVSQAVPFPTKLSLKGKVAEKDAEISRIKYVLGQRELIRELKMFFYDYYFVIKSLNIFVEEKLILDSMLKNIQRKYEGNEAPQQDLVKAALETAKLDDMTINLKKQKNLLRAQINKLLNREQSSSFDIPHDYELAPVAIEFKKEVLLEQSLKGSPLILMEKAGLEKQRHKWSLAKQNYIPDFSFMADYIVIGNGTTSFPEDGNDAWMIGGSLTLPLWFWKINSDIKSEKLKYESQRNEYEDKENFVALKIEDLYFKMESDYQLIDLYENIIVPQAKQNFSTSRISYEQGEVDFLNWLDAQRNLIRLKIAAIKQAAEYKKTVAELEYIVGQDLE